MDCARDGARAPLRPGAVPEENRAVAETAFVEQFELDANPDRQGLFAAPDHDGCNEQVALVWPATVCAVSHPTITSYIRRP